MMISDNLNWYNHGSYVKMTSLYSKVNVTNEGELKRSIINKTLSDNSYTKDNQSKRIIVQEGLSCNCSTDESESKRSIVNEKLSQSCSTNEVK